MHELAQFLMDSVSPKDSPSKVRFTHCFFEAFGREIAGPCGCTNFVFDHQRIPVRHPDLLIDLMKYCDEIDVFDASLSQLANNLLAAFQIPYTEKTLRRKLSEGGDFLESIREGLRGLKR